MWGRLNMGCRVRDKVTGQVGKIVGIADYIYEDETKYLMVYCDSLGRPVEIWVTKGRLEVITR